MENRPPRITEFTRDRVENDARLMVAIDKVVELHPDKDFNAEAGHDAYMDMVSWAMTAYHDAGRTDVDLDGEYLSVSLMDMYRYGAGNGDTTPGHTLAGAALKEFLIDAIISFATSYID